MSITIKELDLGWAEQFMNKLKEAKDTLSSFVYLAHNTIQLLSYLAKLKTHPSVESITKIPFGIVCSFAVKNSNADGGIENHSFKLEAMTTAPTMIQVLGLFAAEHLANLKEVEKDTPELQELLGAVSAFKDRTFSFDPATGCVKCNQGASCGNCKDDGGDKPN